MVAKPTGSHVLILEIREHEQHKVQLSNRRTPGLAKQPEETGPTGKKLCRGRCGKEVAQGRRAWCSVACSTDAKIRAGWNIRFYVRQRDRGVCAECQANGEKAERVALHLKTYRKPFQPESELWRDGSESALGLMHSLWRRTSMTAWWEADHILPVCEGGGGVGLAGYQTLCRPCHLTKTARMREQQKRGR